MSTVVFRRRWARLLAVPGIRIRVHPTSASAASTTACCSEVGATTGSPSIAGLTQRGGVGSGTHCRCKDRDVLHRHEQQPELVGAQPRVPPGCTVGPDALVRQHPRQHGVPNRLREEGDSRGAPPPPPPFRHSTGGKHGATQRRFRSHPVAPLRRRRRRTRASRAKRASHDVEVIVPRQHHQNLGAGPLRVVLSESPVSGKVNRESRAGPECCSSPRRDPRSRGRLRQVCERVRTCTHARVQADARASVGTQCECAVLECTSGCVCGGGVVRGAGTLAL